MTKKKDHSTEDKKRSKGRSRVVLVSIESQAVLLKKIFAEISDFCNTQVSLSLEGKNVTPMPNTPAHREGSPSSVAPQDEEDDTALRADDTPPFFTQGPGDEWIDDQSEEGEGGGGGDEEEKESSPSKKKAARPGDDDVRDTFMSTLKARKNDKAKRLVKKGKEDEEYARFLKIGRSSKNAIKMYMRERFPVK